MKNFLTLAALAIFTLTLTACGGPKKELYTLTGEVSYQGKTVDQGAITFVPTDPNTPAEGATITDGKYTCDVPKGTLTVQITGSKRIQGKGVDKDLILYEDFIPEKYGIKSAVTVTVTGAATENFVLE